MMLLDAFTEETKCSRFVTAMFGDDAKGEQFLAIEPDVTMPVPSSGTSVPCEVPSMK